MKHEVTIQELFVARDAVRAMGALKLSIKAAYWLGRLENKLTAELKSADDQRTELLKKYGTDDGMGRYTVKKDNFPAFGEQFKLLAEEKIEIEVQPMKLSLFSDKDVGVGELMGIMKFLEDDTDDAKE